MPKSAVFKDGRARQARGVTRLAIFLLVALPAPAAAEEARARLQVSAVVVDSCLVRSSGSGASVQCTRQATWTASSAQGASSAEAKDGYVTITY
jgi:hypothetical protein